jgi:hypothetical protein
MAGTQPNRLDFDKVAMKGRNTVLIGLIGLTVTVGGHKPIGVRRILDLTLSNLSNLSNQSKQ